MLHFRQGIKNIPEICSRLGINKAVIAPGSRNAPLIFALTACRSIDCFSVVDERSAAYFALGLAQQSGEPVVLVCTSGTAVLNFSPAIAEAYYQNVPLLVFTSDRPAEMIDQSDGQTIRQQNIYAGYIKASFTLPADTATEANLCFSDRIISQAIHMAKNYPQGPVQINVPIGEPVYTALPEKHSSPKIIDYFQPESLLTDNQYDNLREKWAASKKKMVVIGVFSKNDKLNQLANQLAEMSDVVVVAENLSNVAGNKIISQPEPLFMRINNKEDKDAYIPDLLITIGNSVICKQLKVFLRNAVIPSQWQLDATLPFADTYNHLTTIIEAKATHVLPKIIDSKVVDSNYAELFRSQIDVVVARHQKFVRQTELSDMSITGALLELLPENSVLHLANSTSVRWTQLFASRTDVTYICNRGTSGIDGSTSTAVGYAYYAHSHVFLLTGDISFIYDSNALWNKYLSHNLKIIVLNNNGGNIFRFIGDKDLMKNCFDYFTTPHSVQIQMLVKAFGVDYLCCTSYSDLTKSIEMLIKKETPTVLEVFTDPELNTANYNGYFKQAKED